MRAGYLVTRVVLVWLLTAGTLFLLSAIMPGFHVTNAAVGARRRRVHRPRERAASGP